MAQRKEPADKNADTQEARSRKSKEASKAKPKVDILVDMIFESADLDGYFDPKDIQTKLRNTDLAKSASIIMSNLRLQGFSDDDRLRVPVAEGPETIKKFINLASKLRKHKTNIAFDDAVAMLVSETDEAPAVKKTLKPAATATKVTPAPAAKPAPKESQAEAGLKELYEEAKEKAMKLDAELAAYKEMCFRLIDTRQK